MKTWKAILGIGIGAALAGVGINAICKNKQKANGENEDEYIVDDEVESDDSAEEAAE